MFVWRVWCVDSYSSILRHVAVCCHVDHHGCCSCPPICNAIPSHHVVVQTTNDQRPTTNNTATSTAIVVEPSLEMKIVVWYSSLYETQPLLPSSLSSSSLSSLLSKIASRTTSHVTTTSSRVTERRRRIRHSDTDRRRGLNLWNEPGCLSRDVGREENLPEKFGSVVRKREERVATKTGRGDHTSPTMFSHQSSDPATGLFTCHVECHWLIYHERQKIRDQNTW